MTHRSVREQHSKGIADVYHGSHAALRLPRIRLCRRAKFQLAGNFPVLDYCVSLNAQTITPPLFKSGCSQLSFFFPVSLLRKMTRSAHFSINPQESEIVHAVRKTPGQCAFRDHVAFPAHFRHAVETLRHIPAFNARTA